jgi:arylsulfatase A-like enzyme
MSAVDHLGAYGYSRPTSPNLDAFARSGTVFEQAYTYWPKAKGSFAAMLTGRTAARSGYRARHPGITDFSPTLAGVLHGARYRTVAAVDNPNVARGEHDYVPVDRGFSFAPYDRLCDPGETRDGRRR